MWPEATKGCRGLEDIWDSYDRRGGWTSDTRGYYICSQEVNRVEEKGEKSFFPAVGLSKSIISRN